MGLATVLGLARRGFFVPYRYASGVGDDPAGYDAVAGCFARCRDEFSGWLHTIDGFAAELRAINGSDATGARWDQDWFPRLDAAAAYAIVRRLAPRRIVEIGSGHSTRFMARAIADGGLASELVAIDPQPRASIGTLAIRLVRTTLQDAPAGLLDRLGPDDMLCVDSSHIAMPGTDVDIVVNRILPRLPAGAVVFFHDIFLPDPYPAEWAWRGYNEQVVVGALLQAGYRPLFASRYVATRMAAELSQTVIAGLPLPAGAFESGLWLRKGVTAVS